MADNNQENPSGGQVPASLGRQLTRYELAIPETFKGFDYQAEQIAGWDIDRKLSINYMLAFLIIIAFFGTFVAWSVLYPLQKAAIASGVVEPEGYLRTVQHLEGGIIKDIQVQEGDRVEAGEVLLVLDDTQASVAFDVLQDEQRRLSLTQARLRAEQAGKETFILPHWTVAADLDADAHDLISNQLELFESRKASFDARRSIIEKRIQQLQEEITGLSRLIESEEEQLAYIVEELEGVEQLFEKGYALKTRLLALQRARSQIEGEIASNRSRIARTEQAIGEAQVQLISMREERRDRINIELSDTRSRLSQIEDRLRSSEDILARTRVVAPVAGTILNLRYTSPRGVVSPGSPILDIVPEDSELLVSARVSPLDIDSVEVGQQTRIILTAYKQRNLPELHGRVEYLSADRLIDNDSKQPYYLARVRIDDASLAGLQGTVNIVPGMPVEVMLVSGERTLFDYLAQPVTDTFRRSFSEE